MQSMMDALTFHSPDLRKQHCKSVVIFVFTNIFMAHLSSPWLPARAIVMTRFSEKTATAQAASNIIGSAVVFTLATAGATYARQPPPK